MLLPALLTMWYGGASPPAASPADEFAARTIVQAGASRRACFASIRTLERKLRKQKPESRFRIVCATLPPEKSDLAHLRRMLPAVAGQARSRAVSVTLLEDWTEHYTFGQSFTIKYRVERETVVVWWHPATRLLEIRIWIPAAGGSARPDG